MSARDLARAPGSVAEDRRHQLRRRVAAERPGPREHLVEHHAEREQIGPVIERSSLDLLRRHVRHRPDDRPRRRHLGRGDGSHVGLAQSRSSGWREGQTEIEHLHPSVFRHHDVGRLQVAMGDLLLMRRGERIGQRQRQLQKPLQRQTSRRNQRIERLPLDQFHGQEPDAIRIFSGIDRDDVRVVECGDGAGFAREAFVPRRIGGHAGGQHFQRNIAGEPGIAGAIHLAHSACPERADDLIRPDAGSRVQCHVLGIIRG